MPILIIVAAAMLGIAWMIDRRRRIYADLGTTPAAAVYAGRNEVKGRAWHPEPLVSHLTRTPSVRWDYELEEEREHTRTVSSTDAEGHTSTRTETYREWHSLDRKSGGHSHFDLVDDSGSVRIVVEGASITDRQSHRETFEEEDRRGFLQKFLSLDNRTGRYRETENLIAVGDILYVVGEASLRDDIVEPQIAGGTPFVISTRSEESHRQTLGFLVPVFLLAAIGLAGVAGKVAAETPGAIAGVAAVMAIITAAITVVVFNRLQLLVQQAARAWSLIDIQLARRHDLIPRLASVARAATDHERVVFESISIVRSALIDDAPNATTVAQADHEAREQTDRIRKLLAVVEAYPDLMASEAMSDLQHQLADSENRIAGTRTYYNNAVMILQDRRRTFPGLLVARWADPRRFALFNAEGFERTVAPLTFDFSPKPDSA